MVNIQISNIQLSISKYPLSNGQYPNIHYPMANIQISIIQWSISKYPISNYQNIKYPNTQCSDTQTSRDPALLLLRRQVFLVLSLVGFSINIVNIAIIVIINNNICHVILYIMLCYIFSWTRSKIF